MTRFIQIGRPRRTMVGAAASLLAVAGALATTGTAKADTTVTFKYAVTGTTHLATPNADVSLGPGHLTSTADLNNDGPTTGTIDPNTGAVTTTSNITMKITKLVVAGLTQPIGSSCETSTPVSVTVNSQPGFNILKGGNLAGTYTIPDFANCGLETLLINLTVPGSGNTITLTLGKAHPVTS